MGNFGHLILFVGVGATFLSVGLSYSIFEILLGVLLFLISCVFYFQWEENARKKKASQLRQKAVPSEFPSQGTAASVPISQSVPSKPAMSRVGPDMVRTKLNFGFGFV